MGLCSLATQAANNAVVGNKDGFANTSEKKKFELLRPFFFTAYKFSLVPKSFYLKYCTKKK